MNVRPNVRPHVTPFRLAFLVIAIGLAQFIVRDLSGQSPAASLTVISREPRRSIPLTTAGSQDLVAIDDLAATFQTTVRDDGGAVTMSYKGRTIVLTPDQTIASVAGRMISLPAPLAKVNGRWMVPVDFISRALAGIYDARVELRRPSRLVILGDLRVPRLTLRHEGSGSGAGGGARVTIDIMPRANATVSQDVNQHLTIRFDADALDVAFPPGQVPGVVQGYRSVDATTIVIDLGPRVATFRSATQVADAASTLVIDLLQQGDAVPMPAPTTTQAQAAPAATPSEIPAPVSLDAGLRTIVIDPGHGGTEAGAKGVKGATEKDVTLAMALRLKATLEARLGVRVLMTRDDDHLVPASDRTSLANNNKADLFISLHANGSLRPAASGATVYVASFAEGSVDPQILTPVRLPTFGGGLRDIELVPWNLAQVRYRQQSEVFASLLAEQFRDHVPLAPTPVDRAPLRVLESANMPAVLIESGFLTNAGQEQLLTGADFHGAVAQAIVEAILRFRTAGAIAERTAR